MRLLDSHDSRSRLEHPAFARHMVLDYACFPDFSSQKGLVVVNRGQVATACKESGAYRDHTNVASWPRRPAHITLDTHGLFCSRWSPDCSMIAFTVDTDLYVIDSFTGKKVTSFPVHQETVTEVLWDPDCDPEELGFFTGSLDKTIRLWRNGRQVEVLKHHSNWIRALAYHDKLLISGCMSEEIVGWDRQSGTLKFRTSKLTSPDSHNQQNFINSLNYLSFAKTFGNSVFASATRDGRIQVFDSRLLGLSGGKSVFMFKAHNSKVNSVCFSESNMSMVTAGRDSSVRIWDVRKLPQYLECAERGTAPELSSVRDLSKHTCINYSIPAFFWGNEKLIVTGSENGSAYVYNVDDGTVANTISCGTDAVVHTSGSTDGTMRLITSGKDEMMIWSPCFDVASTFEGMMNFVPSELNDFAPRSDLSPEERAAIEVNRAVWEGVMRNHGDSVISMFQRHGWNMSDGFQDLLQRQNSGSPAEVADLLQFLSIYAQESSRVMGLQNARFRR
eukprot:ANDGO_06917.mRNA.1 putative WD repeat-containing protein alr2800